MSGRLQPHGQEGGDWSETMVEEWFEDKELAAERAQPCLPGRPFSEHQSLRGQDW